MIHRSIKQIIYAVIATITLGSICPINAQIAVPILDKKLTVRQIYEDKQGQIWLAALEGLYRLNPQNNQAILINSTQTSRIYEIYEDKQGQLWLKTNKGIYHFDPQNNQAILINSTQELRIYEIYEDKQGQLWLGTNKGAYHFDPQNNQAILINSTQELKVFEIYEDKQGRLWLGLRRWQTGAYRVDPQNNQAILVNYTQELRIYEIYEDKQGQLSLRTNEGIYHIDPQNNQAILINSTQTSSIYETYEDKQGQIWLRTDTGAYRVDPQNNQALLVNSTQGLEIYEIYEDKQGRLWLRTNTGAYRVDQQNNQAILVNSTQGLYIHEIYEDKQGNLWLGTSKGVYRYYEKVKIDVAIESSGNAGILVNLLKNIFPNIDYISPLKLKPCYTYIDSTCNDNNEPYLESFPRGFEVIFEYDNESLFERQLEEERYQAIDNGIKQELIGNGQHTLYISVRDKWGNISEVKTKTIFVGGWQVFTGIGGIIIVIASWVGSAVALIIAPYNQFLHDLLMNPFLRKYASLGFIPIALSFIPPLRNYVLRRYLKQLRQDEQFSQWREQFIVPSVDLIPDNFGEKIQQKRTIFLQGRSGIGKTSYFQYLTDYYSDKKHHLHPKNVIPVFIPLSRYQGNEAEKMFQSQLEKYGRLFDKGLTAWFLKQGNFLIFLDGLNELSEADRRKINTFVDQNCQANYFCLSSQEPYTNFNLPIVQLASLGKIEIEKLLQNKLGEAKTKDVLKQFNQSSYELYKIPQNLEFAIKLLQNNQPLPQSQQALYQAILKPIFDEWENNGKSDFDDILCQKSYNMLINHNQFFNQSEPKVTDELRNELVKQKFLVQRTDNYQFQHDLIRAYLASLYFSPRWQNLIQDDSLTIDENWRSLLEFSLNNFTQPEEAKKLMFIIVEKHPSLAGKVFTYLQNIRLDLCETWLNEFFSELGKQLNREREEF